MIGVTGGRIRTALFVDFDNMFGGLLRLDRKAALAFANTPEVWLSELEHYGLVDEHRDVLVRRAYINPAGWLIDAELGNDQSRLYLSRFRPFLTAAGFEVIDCPAVTMKHKNAADIRIVIDVLSCLDSTTRYDEFVIASSDSDFMPLLQKLRATDRRAVIMSAGSMSPAYQSVAHVVLNDQDVIALVSEPADIVEEMVEEIAQQSADPEPATNTSTEPTPPASDAQMQTAQRKAERAIADFIRSAERPALLSQAALMVRKLVGDDVVKSTKWFGHGSLGALVRSLDGGAFTVEGHFAWESRTHEPPESARQNDGIELPAVVNDLCRVAGLPRLSSLAWDAVLSKVVEYAETHEFSLAECTVWVRDELAYTATPVGRKSVNFAVMALSSGGSSLSGPEIPMKEDCAEAVAVSVCDRATSTGWALDDSEQEVLRRWLDGKGA